MWWVWVEVVGEKEKENGVRLCGEMGCCCFKGNILDILKI